MTRLLDTHAFSRCTMNQTILILPICELKCRHCGHRWLKAIPLWDRGHVLANKGNLHIFIHDSVRVELGECVDFLAILEPLGFSMRETCPRCSAGEVIVPYPAKIAGKEDVPCTELTAADFTRSS